MGTIISLGHRRHLDGALMHGGEFILLPSLVECPGGPLPENPEAVAPPGRGVWLAGFASLSLWIAIVHTVHVLWQFTAHLWV